MRFTEITAMAWILFLIAISLIMGVLAGQIAVEKFGEYLEVMERVGMI